MVGLSRGSGGRADQAPGAAGVSGRHRVSGAAVTTVTTDSFSVGMATVSSDATSVESDATAPGSRNAKCRRPAGWEGGLAAGSPGAIKGTVENAGGCWHGGFWQRPLEDEHGSGSGSGSASGSCSGSTSDTADAAKEADEGDSWSTAATAGGGNSDAYDNAEDGDSEEEENGWWWQDSRRAAAHANGRRLDENRLLWTRLAKTCGGERATMRRQDSPGWGMLDEWQDEHGTGFGSGSGSGVSGWVGWATPVIDLSLLPADIFGSPAARPMCVLVDHMVSCVADQEKGGSEQPQEYSSAAADLVRTLQLEADAGRVGSQVNMRLSAQASAALTEATALGGDTDTLSAALAQHGFTNSQFGGELTVDTMRSLSQALGGGGGPKRKWTSSTTAVFPATRSDSTQSWIARAMIDQQQPPQQMQQQQQQQEVRPQGQNPGQMSKEKWTTLTPEQKAFINKAEGTDDQDRRQATVQQRQQQAAQLFAMPMTQDRWEKISPQEQQQYQHARKMAQQQRRQQQQPMTQER